MKAKCLIVDDERPARELLESYIEKIPELEIVGSYKNPLEAIHIIQSKNVDILFLDIQMPEIKGTQLLNSITNKPIVIFTTAYQEYALESYEMDVLDYMVKPISFERFYKGVRKALKQISLANNTSLIENVTPKINDFIILKADYKIYRIQYNDIFYIEGLKEYVTFYTKNQKIIVYESLKQLEISLPSNFIRVHKSYIVNKNSVHALSGNQLEINSVKIPLGQSYKDSVKAELFNIQ